MTAAQAQGMLAQLLWQCAVTCAPVLIATLVVGVLVSILQVVTQVQEMSLTYIPKLAVTVIVLTVAGAWMLGRLTLFARNMFAVIPSLG